jgi:hypothetical protein
MSLFHNCPLQLFKDNASLAKSMLTQGMIEALCNLMHEIFAEPCSLSDIGQKESLILLLDIQSLLCHVGSFLFSTPGITSWQQFEGTFSLLLALENQEVQIYGTLFN